MNGVLLSRLPQGQARAWAEQARIITPGFLVAGTIAMAATFLSDHYGGPVMLFALLLGMAFNFLSQEGPCVPGITFASRTVLRFGVACLGARITVEEVVELGARPLVVTVLGVTLTILIGVLLARRLRFTRDFGILTGGAVAICGASAALAIASVLPKGKGIDERDTIFTVIGVTTLSTVAMVVYPILARMLGLDDLSAGIFLGGTIHDVAQVVGAGYSISQEAGDAATMTKLLRVAMLVPVVLVITLLLFRGTGEGGRGKRPPLPLFLFAFVALVAVNSLGLIPELVRTVTLDLSRWALVAAISALGVKTSLKSLAAVGPKALVLIVAETVFLALLGLGVLMAF
jgi:uncharacterized integral membrane protein (TIGR00698 family)